VTSPHPTPIRVLIADDQKVVRDGLAMLLGLLDGIEVIGTAVDLNMPTVDGVEATRRLVGSGARARVVVLTTYADDDWVFRALQAGARGFLTKDAGADEIQQAIGTVAAGQAQLDPSVQRRLLEALAGGARLGVADSAAGAPVDDGLTAREAEVLTEIAEGRSNAEIAARLFVSEATVKTHVNHLLAKTGCRDRAALVGYAYRTGRITP
jgi:DNA-binding NarL/FixJ family response regulator